MHNPVTYNFRIFEARDHLQNTLLFAPFHTGLKTDDIKQGSFQIVFTQLDNGVEFLILFAMIH